MVFLYSLGITVYSLGILLASLINTKARLWIRGRKRIFNKIKEQVRPSDNLYWFHASSLGEFELDTSDLEASWIELNDQIQELIENTPGLQSVIDELRKAKVRGSWERMKESLQKNEKVINLKDFLEPR